MDQATTEKSSLPRCKLMSSKYHTPFCHVMCDLSSICAVRNLVASLVLDLCNNLEPWLVRKS